MEINKANLRQFRKDFEAAVADLAKANKLTIEIGSIRFGSTTFRCRVTCTTVDPKAKARQAETLSKLLTAASGGKFDLGMKFRHNSTIYTIVEFKPSRPKYPFIVSTQRGARYKMSAQHLSIMEVVK